MLNKKFYPVRNNSANDRVFRNIASKDGAGISNGIYLIIFAAFISGVFAASFVISQVKAAPAGETDIVFPVSELGNCKNKDACQAYCEKPENIKTCVNFAEKHNLISKKEAQKARKFAEMGKGPGGCKGKKSCESYCDDVKNISECVAFAEKNGLLPPEELAEAKKVQQALAKGAKMPGGCRNKDECENYCENPENLNAMEECVAFAEAAGFMDPEELEEIRRIMPLMKSGQMPGGCRTKDQCEDYCEDEKNFEECVAFAEKAGFISGEELEMAKKTGGKGPGGCRGKEQCDAFCEDEKNFEVCLSFAEKYDLISEEEAEMARKTGGKGPGGCKGQEECEEFCQNPENQEVCFSFAKEHGLLSEEELEEVEEGKERIKEALEDAPEEVIECLNADLGSQTVQKLQTGEIMPKRDFGDIMRRCFEETMMEEMMGPPGEIEEMMEEEMPEGMEEEMNEMIRERIQSETKSSKQPPSQEQIQQIQEQMRQQIQQQMEQQIRQQIMEENAPEEMFPEDMMPEENNFEEEPQSNLQPNKNPLLSLAAFLLDLLIR